MAKLTRQQAALHAKACALLQKDTLTLDERFFVLEHWQEGANHINSVSGAFFTPVALARDFAIEVFGNSILDLCAGIGSLAFAAYHRGSWSHENAAITCVEINPDYVAVGRKVLPEATWIEADVLNLSESLRGFDCVIANPPFGHIKQSGKAPRYSGSEFEFKVIDIASDRARYGVFLIPQPSSPFQFSGRRNFTNSVPEKYTRFSQQTGIVFEANCGIDTSVTAPEWHGVSITTEIVLADFEELGARRDKKKTLWEQSSLFPLTERRSA